VFVAFLAYYLHVILGRQLKALAPGVTARNALEKFGAVSLAPCRVDVRIPTPETRDWCSTNTQGEPELELLLERLRLTLHAQPAAENHRRSDRPAPSLCSADLWRCASCASIT